MAVAYLMLLCRHFCECTKVNHTRSEL